MKANRKRRGARRASRLDSIQVTLTLPLRDLLPVIQSDGGFDTHECLFCKRIDFLERLVHKPKCPVGKALMAAQAVAAP